MLFLPFLLRKEARKAENDANGSIDVFISRKFSVQSRMSWRNFFWMVGGIRKKCVGFAFGPEHGKFQPVMNLVTDTMSSRKFMLFRYFPSGNIYSGRVFRGKTHELLFIS